MYRSILSGGATVLLLAACGGDGQQTDVMFEEDTPPVGMDMEAPVEPQAAVATARFIDAEGNEVGTATLTEENDGVRIEVALASLPAGERGFHIHEAGRCDTPTFESAGSHFNPTDAAHGFDHDEGPHAGDLENLEIGEDGAVQTTMVNSMITLQRNAPTSVFDGQGTAFIVHESADDYMTQPTGDAGGRIACGVIEDVGQSGM